MGVNAFEWNPWEIYKDESTPLDILEPPCKHCEFWKPIRTYRVLGDDLAFDGVELCHAEQFGDFSCFRPRK